LHIGAGKIKLQQMTNWVIFLDTVYVHANECITRWFIN